MGLCPQSKTSLRAGQFSMVKKNKIKINREKERYDEVWEQEGGPSSSNEEIASFRKLAGNGILQR